MLNRLVVAVVLISVAIKVRSIEFPNITQLKVSNPFIGIGNEQLKFECLVTGKKPIQITWYHNDTKIKYKNGFNVINEGSVLEYTESISFEQNGAYKCVASNEHGTMFNQINVNLPYMGQFNKGNTYSDPPQTITAVIGEAFAMQCPSHSKGTNNVYLWGYLGVSPIYLESGKSDLENAFVNSNGTLFYSTLTQYHVNKVKEAGGFSCIMYHNPRTVRSVLIKIDANEGKPTNSSPVLKAYMDKNIVILEGSAHEILCGAVGYPVPKIKWYKDGVLLDGSDELKKRNFVIANTGMILKIKPVTLESQGVYTCVAENLNGIDSKNGTIIVHKIPQFMKNMKILQEATFKENLTLTCSASGIPKVEYKWYFNNSVISPLNDRYKIDGQQMTILTAGFEHKGLYMCVVSNYLAVKVQPVYINIAAIKPSLVKGMQKPTYIFKNFNSNISCAFKSAPPPVISWQKDGANLTDAYQIKTTGGTSVLSIENVTDKNTGQYRCTATNKKGQASDNAPVRAIVKTVITKPPVSITVKEGESALFFCGAVYEKSLNMTYKWMKNDMKLLYVDGRVYKGRRVLKPSPIIYIKNARMTDGGRYACHYYTSDANAIISEDDKTADFIVLGKPDPPSEINFHGNCSSTDNITLSWQQKNHFGNTVSYYVIEYSDKDNESKDNWVKYDEKIMSQPVILQTSKLAPNAFLKFRIRAVNEYKGTNYISEPVNIPYSGCKTPVGAPIVSPTVYSKRGREGSLTIAWNDSNVILKPGPNYKVNVTYRKHPNGSTTTKLVKNNQLVVSNPGEDERYDVIVQSQNDFGVGPKSELIVLTSMPGKITGVPGNVQANVNTNNVTISWEAVKFARTYKIYYKKKIPNVENARRRRRDERIKLVTVDATETEAVLKDIEPLQEYLVFLAASNMFGEGNSSDPISFKTNLPVPSAPSGVNVEPFGDALRVSWKKPELIEGVEKFVITWYKSDESPPKKYSVHVPVNETSTFIQDLEPLTFYTVEIYGVNEQGNGKTSTFDRSVVSNPDKPGKPSPPEYFNLNATTINVKFVFSPDTYIGGLPKNYTLFYYPDDADKNKAQSINLPFHNTKNNVNLLVLEYRSYKLYFISYNNLGESEPSDETTTRFEINPIVNKEPKAFYEELWFLILIILIFLIILILLIVCCCLNRNGGKYPVGEKEKDRWDDGQPLKDSSDFDEKVKVNGSDPYRSANELEDDKDSLDDYGEDGKFNEDGSFIGEYGSGEKNKPKNGSINGATMV